MTKISVVKPAFILVIGATATACGYLLQAVFDPTQTLFSSNLWLPYHLLIIFGGVLLAIGFSERLVNSLKQGKVIDTLAYFLIIVSILFLNLGAKSIETFVKPVVATANLDIAPPISIPLFVVSYFALPIAVFLLGIARLVSLGISNILGWALIFSAGLFILPRVALVSPVVSILPLLFISLVFIWLGFSSIEKSKLASA